MSKNSEALRLANEFKTKYHCKAISEIMGSRWRELPIQLTGEGLMICVDSQINRMGESVASERFSIEFLCDKNVSTFHLWNQWGVITPRPVKFTWQENISVEAKNIVSDFCARGNPINKIQCIVLVVANGVVTGFKTFGLDSEVTQWMVDVCLASPAEGKVVRSLEAVQVIAGIQSAHSAT